MIKFCKIDPSDVIYADAKVMLYIFLHFIINFHTRSTYLNILDTYKQKTFTHSRYIDLLISTHSFSWTRTPRWLYITLQNCLSILRNLIKKTLPRMRIISKILLVNL